MPPNDSSPKPRIILGLATFGPNVAAGARITSLDEYNRCLDKFQAEGYFEVDTARIYGGGTQEPFTREAKWKERGLKLATKVYPNQPGMHKPKSLVEQFESSLKDLGTDRVDIFYLHAPDRSVPFAETLEAVDKLHKMDKFVEFGLSNFSAFEVAEIVMTCKHNKWVLPTIYEGMYNCITRSIEPELIPACRRYGLDIVVYNPIAGGLLSGKYKTDAAPAEGRFSDASGFGPTYRKRYFKDSSFEALSIIEPVVHKHGLTLVETALRWLHHHSALKIRDGNDGIIIGVSSYQQLESNLKDLEKGPLPEEVLEALDKAWLVKKADAPNYWHLDINYSYDTEKVLFGN
ncbi:NADP-dependent oxidoreductase domain-containing protein [Xylogone sp. PMI_703]|nr:NADP-dependent oxidoreductase domain-containing protein [Xylogone sp. PMI_703]